MATGSNFSRFHPTMNESPRILRKFQKISDILSVNTESAQINHSKSEERL